MKKIFLPYKLSNFAIDSIVSITGDDYNHIAHSLRATIGEEFIIGDDDGTEWQTKIENITKNEVRLKIAQKYARIIKNTSLTLIFSLLKGEKNDDLIKRCTEIGVDRFIPVVTANSIIKIDQKNAKNKLERWETIAKEASMQSNRYKIPKIEEITSFNKLSELELCKNKYFGQILSNIDAKKTLSEQTQKDVAIFVGPEGDFTQNEEKSLQEQGWIGLRFETNVLRSETAAIYFASILTFLQQ